MLKIFKIRGNSLYPDFQNGDFVLVARSPFPYIRMKVGDVIAFHKADHGLMIKRIHALTERYKTLEVRGSVIESVDSRSFGPISKKDVIGKIIWHIPQPRTG